VLPIALQRAIMLNVVRRLGIMGGTFDPIHYGHLRIAELACEAFALDQVVFVPNGRPAHKDNSAVGSARARLAMTELAVASNPRFACSRMEFDRAGPSYAIDTVRGFRRLYPHLDALCFITGADTIREIFTWHQARQLMQECQFIAVTRPGFANADLHGLEESMLPSYSYLAAPGLEISSTDLRRRVRAGLSIKYLVPEAVEEYIRREGLYGKP